VAEGARLESVYTFTGIGGSNPSLSAIQFELQRNLALFLWKVMGNAVFSRF
jgi:hypothetical protein